MPSRESYKPLEKIKSAEPGFDFDGLQKQKEALFHSLEEDSLKLDKEEKEKIVSLTVSHSIKDGFELSKRLGLSGKDFAWSLNYAIPKNKKFIEEFTAFADGNKAYVEPLDFEFYLDQLKKFNKGEDAGKGFSAEDWEKTRKFPHASEINEYYTNFIRNRSFRSPELPRDSRTVIEAVAEDHLLSVEAMLKESYYTGPVKEFLGIKSEDHLEQVSHESMALSNDHIPEENAWDLRNNLISREALAGLLYQKGYSPEENLHILEHELKKARYVPSKEVFDIRKNEAIKGLIEGRTQKGIFEGKPYTQHVDGIKDSLIKRGFKEEDFEIKLNEESGEYEVVDNKEDLENKKNEVEVSDKKKNIRLDKTIDNQVGTFKVSNDVIVTIIKHGTDSATVIFPDNTEMKVDSPENFEFNSRFGKTKNGYWCQYLDVDEKGEAEIIFNYEGTQYDKNSIPSGYKILSGPNSCGEAQNGESIFTARKQDLSVPGSWVSAVFMNGNMTERQQCESIRLHGSCNDGDVFKMVRVNGNSSENFVVVDLVLGGIRMYGPYEEIIFCENSKDKLVFYAKKDNKHIAYVDGNETQLPLKPINPYNEAVMTGLIKTDDGYHLHANSETTAGDRIESIYNFHLGEHGQLIETRSNFSSNYGRPREINGKLFAFGYDKDGEKVSTIYYGCDPRYKEKIIPMYINHNIDFQSVNNKVVGHNGTILITDGKRLFSAKDSEVQENNTFQFKQDLFKGTIDLVKSDKKLFIIETLPEKKRIWEYLDTGELKLSENEQRDLDLLNAVVTEDPDTIEDYFANYYPGIEMKSPTEKIKSGIKNAIEQSSRFVGAVNQTIKDMPELFLDTLRAKNDKPTEYLMTEMFNYIFPEAVARKEKALEEEKRRMRSSRGFLGGIGGKGGQGELDGTVNYDTGVNSLESVDEAGYYEMMKANREVLRLREPLSPYTFIVRGIFGQHTNNGWTKVNVPISQEVQDPAQETTFEFVDEKASQYINLPRLTNSKIITERVKGITKDGSEILVNVLEENVLGEVRIDKGDEASRLVYSMAYSKIPMTMSELPERDYEKFKNQFEKSFGDVMTEPIGDLGDELNIFVDSLNEKTPREKVIAIQEFCYQYGYYNLDNKPRDTNKLEERLAIMEGRMEELRSNNPELASKKYAGICTDFATLTTALLRKAGFVSSIATGFVPQEGSTVVKTDSAHAVSFVLWPRVSGKVGESNQFNKPDFIIVDGTPSDITPRILESEKRAAEMNTELSVDAEKELAELEHILKTMNVDEIKKLENGVLEKTLNHILRGVDKSHVDVMGRVLNASRYAGFDILEMTRGNIDDQIEFRKFLEEEIYKEKSTNHENHDRLGEELFEMMRDFFHRFEKDKNVRDKTEALDVLEKIFDTAEKYLEPLETRSAAAIITYLRARRMK